MNLTKEQLEQIRGFIQQKGFNYIDVQMEILDHVASSVEEKMEADQHLKFEDAVVETHQSFGIMGFNTIADGITNSIKAKYSRLFWQNFISAFGYKYVLLLCFLIFSIYKIQEILTATNYYLFLVLGMLIVYGTMIFSTIQVSRYKKYVSFKSGISFLSLLGSVLLFANLAVEGTPSNFTIFSIHVQSLIVLFSIVLFVLFFYAAIKTAKTSIRETKLLKEKYKLLYS
ncbi:hypothetical protein [Pedobacter miscanthi]|uniref:hypothetical protein n=1 Tax=Pedobacter miscanthi TaxID=2259170 RepID=UPI00292E023F|nr:hypothetical protein [Pedobacter miscanthi]